MPRVSKVKLEQNQLEEINAHLSYLISSLNNYNDIENFLEEFMTKEEKIMLSKRLLLFMMLKNNYSPSSIQAALHVSYETVRTYKNQLDNKNAQFNQIIERLIKRDQAKILFEKIDKLLKPLGLALRSKTDMRARAKFLSGDY